jgi:hypothetical protein
MTVGPRRMEIVTGHFIASPCRAAKPTWILLSVFRRNHWGMGRFWREALASFCLMRKVFWDG